jgi:hypothetical protein
VSQQQEYFSYLSLFLRCAVRETQCSFYLDIPCLAYEIRNVTNFQCFLSTRKVFLFTIFLRRDIWEKKGVTFRWKIGVPAQKNLHRDIWICSSWWLVTCKPCSWTRRRLFMTFRFRFVAMATAKVISLVVTAPLLLLRSENRQRILLGVKPLHGTAKLSIFSGVYPQSKNFFL